MWAGCWVCHWLKSTKLTKLIPGTPGTHAHQGRSRVFPTLSKMYNESPVIKQVIDLALKLEGMCRNAGVHAARRYSLQIRICPLSSPCAKTRKTIC